MFFSTDILVYRGQQIFGITFGSGDIQGKRIKNNSLIYLFGLFPVYKKDGKPLSDSPIKFP